MFSFWEMAILIICGYCLAVIFTWRLFGKIEQKATTRRMMKQIEMDRRTDKADKIERIERHIRRALSRYWYLQPDQYPSMLDRCKIAEKLLKDGNGHYINRFDAMIAVKAFLLETHGIVVVEPSIKPRPKADPFSHHPAQKGIPIPKAKQKPVALSLRHLEALDDLDQDQATEIRKAKTRKANEPVVQIKRKGNK